MAEVIFISETVSIFPGTPELNVSHAEANLEQAGPRSLRSGALRQHR